MLRKTASAAAATLLATLALVPAAAGTLVVKDGNSASQSLRTVVNSDSSQTYVHALQDTTGTLIDPATKQLQQQIISTLGSPLQAGGTVTLGGGTNAIGSVTITGTPTVSCSNCSGGGGGGTVPTGTAGSPNAAVLSVQGITNGTALPVTGTFFQATQPVSASALPLPTGAGTAANQATIISNTAADAAANAPFGGAVAMTVGASVAAGRSVLMNCTAAGNVSVTFADSSTLVVPISATGITIFPFAVTAVNSSGTTATCTYANLK